LRVVIIGAGPAGLFSAYHLSEECEVVVIEEKNYVGGSGLHSDGKLNFNPFIGGNLTEFVDLKEAWNIINEIERIFIKLGAPPADYDEEKMSELEKRAIKAGIKFIPIRQSHIGSDVLPSLMENFKKELERRGVVFRLKTKAVDIKIENNKVVGVETDKGFIDCDALLLAPGRSGSLWLFKLAKKYGIETRYNPIDVGVRVEVPNTVMDEIINDYKCWDPKFHIRTPSYDDFVRTFCVCPSGFVVKEYYEDSLFGVNGHSMRNMQSSNTNFALLVTVKLTHPVENTTLYGKMIAQLANTLGGGKPLLQRVGDLKAHRRSTWERIERSYTKPTLRDVTPGDICMAYPGRIVTDILEGLEMLDKVIPGIYSNSTLIYAPEIKFYAMRFATDRNLRTKIENLFVAGDGAGVSRGIVGAAATGIIAAKGIKKLCVRS